MLTLSVTETPSHYNVVVDVDVVVDAIVEG